METQSIVSQNKRITVPGQTLASWKLKVVHGDKTQIADKYKLSRLTVINAFAGVASPATIKAINEFFNLAA